MKRATHLAIGVVLILAGQAWADDAPRASDDAAAALMARLEAQQDQIAALRAQVAAQQDVDQARADELRRQVREVLGEQAFRESLVPSTVQAGYDRGFFIRSSDEKFRMKIGGMLQFRWTHLNTRADNRYLLPGFKPPDRDRTGFDLARVRFRVAGHAYTKDLTYLIEMDMTSQPGYDARLIYAWMNYRFIDEFQVAAGIFRVGGTRADLISTSSMQFVDYPPMNAIFGFGYGLGARFWGKLAEGKGEYSLYVLNSLGSYTTRTITTDETWYASGHDNNPGVVFRTVWQLAGGACEYPDDAGHFASPCDLEIHKEPAWNVAFNYAFNEDTHDGTLRIPFPRRTFFRKGGFGLTTSDGLQIHQFGVDTGFKLEGFSATAEYVVRVLDVRNATSPPFTPLFQLTADDSTSAQHGAYVQCGYLLPLPGDLDRKIEVVGRVGGMSALSGGQEGTWEYAAGVNYFIDGHRVKLQADVTKVSELPISGAGYGFANVNDDALIWRVQLQLAF